MIHPWAVQRLELYTSGVKLPPLGSPQDRVLRGYLTKKAVKEVNKNKVLAFAAAALAGQAKSPDSAIKAVLDCFNDYAASELFLDKALEDIEQTMRDEYEFWKKVTPKVNISKDGKLSLSVNSLRPKS